MTVEVTMLQTRWGEDGTLWNVSTTHSASLEFAQYLVGNQFATGTLPTAMQSYPCTMLVATTAELAAMSGEPGVFYAERDGVQRLFRWVGGAMEEVGSGGGGSGTHLGTLTAASMLATPSPVAGWTCRVSDVGNTSPWFEYDGAAWVPLGRRQLIYRLTADESGVVMSTTLQAITPACAIPAGVLDFVGATLEWGLNVDKSAGVNAVTLAGLFGSANDNTDAQITNPSTRTQQGIFTDGGFRRASATSVRVVGSGNAASISRFYDATNSARPAAVTVPDLGTTAQYLRMYGSMASGTDTVTASRWHVWMIG